MGVISIDLRTGDPIYLQLKEKIIYLACQGLLQPDEQLPSVRALARELGINPNTVSKAYQELESEGVIYSVSGRGSFLSPGFQAVELLRKEAFQQFCMALERAHQVGVPLEQLDRQIRIIYQQEGA